MRCTECSREILPVVAVDIDGTLGDWHNHFIRFSEGYFGRSLPSIRGYDGDQEFWKFLQLSLRDYRAAKLAFRQSGLKRTMPVFSGAREFMRNLQSMPVEVWICTTRPYLRLDNIDPDTREWLRRNQMHFDHMIYGDEKYEQLSELVDVSRVVGVLEDLPEQYRIAEKLGFGPLLMLRLHNSAFRGEGGVQVVRDFPSALGRISERVELFFKGDRE